MDARKVEAVPSAWSLQDPQLRSVLTTCVTLGIAVGVYAISFGVASVAAGFSITQTCVMSLLVFTGASQFSVVSVIAGGGSIGSAMSGALLLSARNAVFGLTMSSRLRGRLATRLLAAQLTIDESTAMATAQDEPGLQRAAFWVTGLSVYVCWNLGTLVGALVGGEIDPRTYGLDAAIPAAFVAMLWPRLRIPVARRAAIIGFVLCLATIPLLPIGVPVLIAAAAIVIGVCTPPPVMLDAAGST